MSLTIKRLHLSNRWIITDDNTGKDVGIITREGPIAKPLYEIRSFSPAGPQKEIGGAWYPGPIKRKDWLKERFLTLFGETEVYAEDGAGRHFPDAYFDEVEGGLE